MYIQTNLIYRIGESVFGSMGKFLIVSPTPIRVLPYEYPRHPPYEYPKKTVSVYIFIWN